MTGSFKFRGAMSKLTSLSAAERKKGVVTASTGNHGSGVALGLVVLHCPGIVFLPEDAPKTKIESIRKLGVNVELVPGDPIQCEKTARVHADQNDMTYISPYNDWQVIGGQGTVGLEMNKQQPELDAVFVSVGGGGLISGIAGYFKSVSPSTKIIGCSPENSCVMIESVKAGRMLDLPSRPTLSDGTAGGVELDTVTFKPCRDLVDAYVTVTESEISRALATFMKKHQKIIEGSAAVAIAAYAQNARLFVGKRVGIVLCGANIGADALRQVLSPASAAATA